MNEPRPRLPACCVNPRGDVFAKHRYEGRTECLRCGHELSQSAAYKRDQRAIRRKREKEKAA